MEKLENIFTNFKSLIGFLIMCIFIQMVLGEKTLYSFLWLVLLSMLIINHKKFTTYLQSLEKKGGKK